MKNELDFSYFYFIIYPIIIGILYIFLFILSSHLSSLLIKGSNSISSNLVSFLKKRKSTRIKHTIKYLSDNYEKLELGSSHYDIVEMYTTEILEEIL